MRPFRFLCLAMVSLALLSHAVSLAAQQRPLQGTFTGTLEAGEAELHVVLHLSRNTQGVLNATLDSLDQAVFGIEASSVVLDSGILKFEVRRLGIYFEGKVSGDQKTIDGEWRQGSASLPLVFQIEPASHKPEDAKFSVEGLWQGALETNGLRLRLQLHVTHDQKGELIAALDSLDQFVSGLPAAKVSQKDNSFHFEIPSLESTYDGTLDVTKSSITGEWSQSEIKQKLEFKRSDQPLELRRPQTPVKPYPYVEEQVTFSNATAGVSLSGTLTLPKGTGPFSAAVLIAGSGPEDRDGTIANHKPFLVLSDYLTRKGIAVLRYDKRGIGQSTGSADMATTMDLAGDAQCAIAYLKTRKDIDPARIGLIGHSEGAMIAPTIAASSPDLPWVVLLAAPATKGEDTLLNQSDLIARAGGLSDAQVLSSLNFDKQAYDLVLTEQDSTVVGQKLKALVKESGLDASLPPAALEAQLHMMTSPWFRYFLAYDPLPELKKTKCPVLAIYGTKDLQVPPKINLPMVQKAFADGGNSHAEVKQLPDLNHLFQHAYTGSPTEYAAIDETFSPDALQMIGEWVTARTKGK
ncbi:MAG: alpha/beta hydrolase [Candidatus Acidiferrum sp.]